MAKIHKSWEEESRDNWGQLLEPHENVHNEGVQIGCLQRIANSLEKIEKPFADLISENKRLKEGREYHLTKIAKLEKRVAAYKGIVNRMKKLK